MGEIPESAHYRESSVPEVSCATCLQYDSGRCSMWDTEVDPSMVCDEWERIVSDHTVAPPKGQGLRKVPAATLVALLQAGYRRAEELEPKLMNVLIPILDAAGSDAASAFERRATDHLTAALKGDTAADVTPSSGMVALYPTAEQALSVAEEGGEAPELMHVTLCYLGKDVSEEAAQRFAAALGPVAASHPPLAGHVGGIGSFDDNGGGHPAILLPDVPGLVELRQAVCEAVLAAGGDYPRDHGFQPHLTVAYRDGGPLPPDPASLGLPLSFGALRVVLGNEVVAELPLTGAASLTAAGDPQWSAPAGDEIIDVAALVSKLRTKTDPVRRAVVESVMKPVLNFAGIDFDVTNPLAAKVLAQSGAHVTSIADTTRLNIMRIVRASHEEGLTIPDTAKAIRAGMKESSMARATLIARTELVGAVNGGSLSATRIVEEATGAKYTKTWLTSPGALYPRHEEYEGLDGQTVGLDEYFDVGEDQLEFPGDPNGSPDEVCNCRCTLVYSDEDGGGEMDAEG